MLSKMVPQDDPDAFIKLFEQAAECCITLGWPHTQTVSSAIYLPLTNSLEMPASSGCWQGRMSLMTSSIKWCWSSSLLLCWLAEGRVMAGLHPTPFPSPSLSSFPFFSSPFPCPCTKDATSPETPSLNQGSSLFFLFPFSFPSECLQ